MIYTTRKLFAALVVSLFVLVISLPGIIYAAAPPAITTQKPVTDGMVAPVRIAMDKHGNYYISDPLSKGVLKYNLYGRLIKIFKVQGVPLGIAVASNDNIIVTQGRYASILDPSGVEIAKLGHSVIQFIKANGVTVGKDDGNQKIFVTDGLGNEVQVFDLSGNFVKRFGSQGDAPNSSNYVFHNPSAIAYEKASDQIAVADSLNGRVQFFNATDFTYAKTIGTLIDNPLGFISPQGVAFEYTNDVIPLLKRMYVVDTWRNTIQVIDPATPTGIFLSYIGSFGNAPGQLQTPSDLVFDNINSTGRLLVVNGAGNLQIYGVDGGLSPSDTTPPQLTINTPNNTSIADLTLSGTVEANAVVKVSIDTAANVGPVVSSPTWSCPITGLIPGPNTITVTATDAALNSTSIPVTVVYTPPAPALTIATPNNSLTNSITGFTINGNVAAGAAVSITNTTTGASAGNATVTGTGPTLAWSYLATQLQEGPNTLTVTATNGLSAAKTMSIVVIRDTVDPDLSVSAIADGSYSATSTQNIAGKVVDLHPGTVSMTVNGGAATTATTSDFSFSATLQSGANTIVVQATDLAGNPSVIKNRTINYDPTKPRIAITTPADNSITGTATGATISGTVTNPATATVTVAGIPVTVTGGAWGPTPVTLVNGLNTISVVATSGANSAEEKRTVTLDANAPAVAITSPAQDITSPISVANMLISGTVTDAATPVTVTAMVNGVAVTPDPTVIFGTYQFNADLADGPNAVVVTARDAAGNVSFTTRNILSDRTPPALTLKSDPSGNPKAISGTMESGATVTVVDAGYAFPVTYNIPHTTWSAILSGHTYNPAKIQITATDVAGNTSVLNGLVYTPPTGDIDGVGGVTILDARRALQFVVNPALIPDAGELSRGDIGPLLNGKANPNGVIDITDAMIILRIALDPTFSLL